MYIEPNSTIKLLKNVPLDPSYTDTLYFSDLTSQLNAFNTIWTKRTFERQSYQRARRGVLRLQVLADTVYDYNYMLFQNTAYGNKWFFAFIKSIDYINDNTSEINYELDVMQTWFFEAQLEPCFVEREHAATDEIGENIAPEPVDLGPIICDDIYTMEDTTFTNYCIIIASAENLPVD